MSSEYVKGSVAVGMAFRMLQKINTGSADLHVENLTAVRELLWAALGRIQEQLNELSRDNPNA